MARTAQAAGIAWRRDVTAAAREAGASNKPLLLMVTARWCRPCHQMLQQTFPDPWVAARVNASFIPLLIDAGEQQSLIQQLNINAFPTMLILDSQQRVVERVTGYQTVAQLTSRLAVYQPPVQPRVVQRPVNVVQPLRPAAQDADRRTSFHDRIWASIRQSGYRQLQSATPREMGPAPSLRARRPPPRDTYAAAVEFSAGR